MQRQNRNIANVWLCLALLAALSTQSAIALNKCVDADGRVSYSDQPCPADSKKQELSAALKSASELYQQADKPVWRDCSKLEHPEKCQLITAALTTCKGTTPGQEHFECFARYVKAHPVK
jgi:hypothetical protein